MKLVAALAIAGAVFFFVRTAQLHLGYRAMSQLQARRVELEEARDREERPTFFERVRAAAYATGYDGDFFPFAAALAFLYLGLAAGLVAFSVPYWLAYTAALPAAGVLVWSFSKWVAAQRRKRFNTQLVEMLEMVAGQIEGGAGALRALNLVVPTLPDPIREEFLAVLDENRATRDLLGAMRRLEKKYPSRALALFIAALEIDQRSGQRIGPAIRQAAELLNSDAELRAEANAEIMQQRMEFFGIVAILLGIAGFLIFGGDEHQKAAYTSFAGLAILLAGAANMFWGIWRVLGMLRKIQGEEL